MNKEARQPERALSDGAYAEDLLGNSMAKSAAIGLKSKRATSINSDEKKSRAGHKKRAVSDTEEEKKGEPNGAYAREHNDTIVEH
mmetsp:Transcript_11423/g.19300  ORF Transcript_11423/g.19300 Transcript_11423/m.19300 type:complete len:85 (-) Transcript_11423:1196-1450(-)